MRVGASLGSAAVVLVACNALVGVEEVTLRRSRGGPNFADAGDDDTTEPSEGGSTPGIDRGRLSLGLNHGCARLPTNGVVCWGDNGGGQLGLGVDYDAGNYMSESTRPLPVPTLTEATDVASAGNSACAVQGGKVFCWGLNTQKQLGVPTGTSRPGPVEVSGLTDAVTLAGGTSFMCAIRADKTLWCWGSNISGQLGNGDVTKTSTAQPGPVKDLEGVVDVSGGGEHACAALESGEVYCWGGNGFGQLGNGTVNESLVPVRAPSLSDVVQVATGARSTCARQRSGRVLCWGSNQFGELGTGSPPSTAANPSPIAVPGLTDATFIAAGRDHACAVKRGGSVVCWGNSDVGQLGGGTVPEEPVTRPAAVVVVTGARAVTTAGDQSCALLDEGRAFCWGANALGQLGNGSRSDTATPTAVSNFP